MKNCIRCGVGFAGDGLVCQGCRTAKAARVNLELSFRERQVAELVAQGKLNKEIAWELHLTVGTIKQYINHIFQKLGVSNRTQLAVHYITQRAAA